MIQLDPTVRRGAARAALALPLVLAWLAPLAAQGLLAPPAAAQKLGRAYHEDPLWGFKFKPLDDYAAVPLQPDEQDTPLIGKMSGPELQVKTTSGERSRVAVDMKLFAMTDASAEEGEDEGRTTAKTRREDVAKLLTRFYRGFDAKDVASPEVDEEVKVKKLMARHRTWKLNAGEFLLQLDVWTFPLEHADVSLVWVVTDDDAKDYLRVFEKSAKTFTEIPREAAVEVAAGASYEDLVAAAEADVARTPGWRALPTPSKKFIIKTSSDNKRFIDEVIDRLEKSREIYEEDFPPPPGFDAVSVVRLCGSEEEFHKYGGTGGGVAGWFSPSTEELVLYDAKDVDRNMSFAVMSHEAFHQYCHFLFAQSEAHRWFDEGHGDYYGGIEFKGARPKVTPQMPAGLDRLSVIREMAREKTYKPIRDHINFNHQQWQTQGPSNVSCYAQSWSIIYFLRQGTLRKVSRKCWKEEYADIIPNYVDTLSAGFQEAYDEIRKERVAKAEAEGREPTEEELKVNRFDLRPGIKDEIWKQAMDAAWGEIDLDLFQEDWLVYIDKYLK